MPSLMKIDKTWNGKSIPSSNRYDFEFSLSPVNGDMQIVLNAPFHNDPAPPFQKGKVDGLHEYEVAEIFISGFPYTSDITETPYLEIQIGPHGHYFLAFFMREADWMNQDLSLDFLTPPIIDITHSTKRWHATISIPSYYLPEPQCGDNFAVEWRANVTAIHGPVGERQYLSANVLPGNQPNFHQLASFVPIQLFETLEIRSTVDRSKSIVHDKLSLTPTKYDGNNTFQQSNQFSSNNKTNNNNQNNTLSVTEELRRAVMEESLLAVEGRMSGSNNNDGSSRRNNYNMSVIMEEDDRTTFSQPPNETSSLLLPIAPGTSIQPPPPPPPSVPVEQVARQIRENLLRSDLHSNVLADLDEASQRHLLPGEFVILHSVVWKRHGISFKKRRLVLTSKPRLLYLTLAGEFKGQISWSMTKKLQIVKRSDKKFDITPAEGNRTYHFTDSQIKVDVWIEVLENIMQAQRQYLVASRNVQPV